MRKSKVLAMVLALSMCASMMTACNQDKSVDVIEPDNQDVVAQTTDTVADATEEAVTEEATTEEVAYETITSDEKYKEINSIAVVGDTAYEVFDYVDSSATDYANVVNSIADKLDGQAEVYAVVAPISSAITFPDNLRGDLGFTDPKGTYDKINEKFSDKVHVPNVYDQEMRHRTEYTYYRTDHHWTSLGAYYAYQSFCNEAGITYHEPGEYTTENYGAYVGSFYNDIGDDGSILKEDDFDFYDPIHNDNMEMTYEAANGSSYTGGVILPEAFSSKKTKYGVFIGGDNPITTITNSDITDGSTCVIVKESFGNAFVPYVADHYQTTYVLDYRYWDGSITEFAKEKNATTVILCNNLSMTRNSYLIGKLTGVQ